MNVLSSKRWLLLLFCGVLAWSAFGDTPSLAFGDEETKVKAEKERKKKKRKHDIDVLFSPGGGCTERIVKEIGKAKKKIRVQAYVFTSTPIAKAIRDAHRRGVDCEVILDESQKKATYSELDFFHNQGVPVFVDGEHAIAHNKLILIDNHTVITGSFNFTKAAEDKNAENILILRGYTQLAKKYAENYAKHRAHSRKYEGRNPTAGAPRGPPSDEEKPKAKPKEETNDDDPIVYVTSSGSKYHRGSCSYLRKSKIAKRLSECGGYSPCSRCHPPTLRNNPPKDDRPPKVSDGRCTAITKKGTRCKRKARSGGRCWQHGG